MQKTAQIFTLLIVLVSCTVDPIDSVQNNSYSQSLNTDDNLVVHSNNTTILNSENAPRFMNANLNGFQFNELKPIDYFDANSNEVAVETYTTEATNYNYLLIQGSNTTVNNAANIQSILINLRIPQTQWIVGTYELFDARSIVMNGTTSNVELFDMGRGIKTESIQQGSITITSFDTTNRIITGTFSFTYYLQNGNTVEGPFDLTTGTFNYQLDAPNFL